jgi:diadenylate cyclase
MGGVEDDRRLVIQDYYDEDASWHVGDALEALARLDTDDLLDLKTVATMLHLGGADLDLEVSLQPRGHRLLAKVPRLPESVIDHIVSRFGNLQKILRATIGDLDDVEGVGETRARAIKDGLSRLAETSILDRYS